VRRCEAFLVDHVAEADAIPAAIASAGIPEPTLKRHFRSATGMPLIDHLQNLRVEHGKQLLETTDLPVEEVSAAAGYADPSFFRRLFRRRVGLAPGAYRRMFGTLPQPSPQASAPMAA
jgi:transcriptional regulator GlxA family with amidase domain